MPGWRGYVSAPTGAPPMTSHAATAPAAESRHALPTLIVMRLSPRRSFAAFDDARPLDCVEPRVSTVEPLVAALDERILTAGANSPGTFTMLGVQAVEDLHAGDDAAERREGFFVVRRRVVAHVEEDLRRPPVRHREGERDRAAHVRLLE